MLPNTIALIKRCKTDKQRRVASGERAAFYFCMWLRSMKNRDWSPFSSPQTRILGLVAPHYLAGLRSQMPSGCSHCSQFFLLSFCSSALSVAEGGHNRWCNQFTLAFLATGTTLLETLLQSWWAVVSGRSIKKILLMGPKVVMIIKDHHSILVSRLQLVSLTTVFLFLPSYDRRCRNSIILSIFF